MIERILLPRIENLEIVVLAPDAAVPWLEAAPIVDPARHHSLLAQVVRLRAKADLGGDTEEGDPHDRASWHVLAISSEGGDVVGGTRFRVHDLRQGFPSAADCLDYADVRIVDQAAAMRLSRALEEHIAAQGPRGWGFYQVGGFVVAPDSRNTGVGLVLAVTTSVLVAQIGLLGGCIFATTTNKVDSLLCMVGGYPLRCDGRELPPLYCERHRAFGVLLGSEAGRLDPQLLSMRAPIVERLRTATVLAP